MKRQYISISLMFSAVLLLGSCKKFLDVQPKENISDDVTIVDEASAKTAVRGIYNQLASNGYYGYSFQTIGFFSGDNIEYTGSQTVNKQLTNHDVKSDLGVLATSWSAIYNTINRANNVIAKVPVLATTGTFTDSVKNGLLGEAYFIRALAYFDLARTWGGVQLVLEPTASAGSRESTPRATLQETYAQVLKDLVTAEGLLPEKVNRIRASKQTVWALRARYHLYQQQWAEAEAYASKLIGDIQNYQLLSPYNAFFANNALATKESIFELYYSTTSTNNQASQWLPTTKGGVGWIKPTTKAIGLLNDPAVGGNRNSLLQVVSINSLDTWWGNLYYRIVSSGGTDPAYLIRVGEMYLIRAEARAQQDKLEDAAFDLNAIRRRAGLEATTAANRDDLLLAIENENQVEFALENHRWYDLLRTGRAQTVLGISDPNKLLLPIPYSEVLVDPNLPQNPGY
ncbi:RagB/SusD family nutrient uptake outer membrane protein [Flavihumibacter petaseus]|uniref:RagB/SusD family nutrient uptake outer membrane protein n=1 Tax=Flavihumibacter petaseus NBRC 106054 TaxID=1220578 RepID=A0A0E9MY37_9BACT|nr:RagB/SusD family nutrient uptake outer membrane protein [Flavihumibacter petaseus]GAO42494.1 hypothetical protein FPE01S_01_15080 [Flavihumibacter petaseus NBRC 106054]